MGVEEGGGERRAQGLDLDRDTKGRVLQAVISMVRVEEEVRYNIVKRREEYTKEIYICGNCGAKYDHEDMAVACENKGKKKVPLYESHEDWEVGDILILIDHETEWDYGDSATSVINGVGITKVVGVREKDHYIYPIIEPNRSYEYAVKMTPETKEMLKEWLKDD